MLFFSFLQSHYLLFFIKYYLVTIQASFSLSDTSVNHDEFIKNNIKGYTWEVEWGWLVKPIEMSPKSLKIKGWCLKSPRTWWCYWYMTPNVDDKINFLIVILWIQKKKYTSIWHKLTNIHWNMNAIKDASTPQIQKETNFLTEILKIRHLLLIMRKKKKPRWMYLILRKSYLNKNIDNRTLNSISKWVEYVSLKVASHNNEFVEQVNPISKNCLWNYR